MKILLYMFYGFACGFTELIPVSGQAHQYILQYVLGIDNSAPVLDMLVHFAILAAIFVGNFSVLSRLRRDIRLHKKKRLQDLRGIYDIRISKTASILMVIGMFAYTFYGKWQASLDLLIFTSLFSGAVLLVADHMRQGNKNSSNFSVLNAIAIGFGCAFSAIPGISRVGMTLAIATGCGADKSCAYHWALLISIPALVIFIVLDLLTVFTVGVGTITLFLILAYILAAGAAFVGAYAAISFIRYLCVRTGFSGVAYYNIGVAVFSFVLFMIT